MFKLIQYFLLISLLLTFGSCARMTSSYEPPTVGLKTFKMLPSDEFMPRFEIGLHLINPNREPLNIEGLYYTVSIEGHKVLAGVTNDLPVIGPYGEGDIIMEATTDILSGAKLLGALLTQPKTSFHYTFNAKLDLGRFVPPFTIMEEGQFSPLEDL